MFIDAFGKRYYKLALHLHSTRSDGRLSPEEIAAEYKADGFDAIALTDHWVYADDKELAGLHVITGCEYNTGAANTEQDVMHIVGFGMQQDPAIDRKATRQQIVDGINRAGGMAVLAHPAWSLNTLEDYKALDGIAATEIYNAVSEAGQSMRPYSGYFVDVSANAGLFPVLLATDDAHYYDGSDNRRGWVMVQAQELEDELLLKALKRGEFYATQGPWLHVVREGDKLEIDCSPCALIGTLSNKSWAPDRVLRGTDLTHFEYALRPDENWVRVEVQDADGRFAWSNVFVINDTRLGGK